MTIDDFCALLDRRRIAYTRDGAAITVGGWLYLSGRTGLAALPDGLTVGGSLYLRGCTGLKSSAGWIVPPLADQDHPIAARLAGGAVEIIAGCFRGDLAAARARARGRV